MSDDKFLSAGLRTIRMEAEAVNDLSSRINQAFSRACKLLLACQGRVIVSGMGKSGHVGKKIAATLASTGTPAFFIHPGEASHGDLGMVTRGDAVIAISNSGSSAEVLAMIPGLKRLRVPIISMTGDPGSPLAEQANVNLDISVRQEACPLDLAPTSSTTVTLVMGDALAIALLEERGFTAEDFAFSHPGGALGRKLLLKVSDIMHHGSEIPKVSTGTALSIALVEMTHKGFGMTTVVSHQGELMGIFTDGDLRRSVDQGIDIGKASIDEVMTQDPLTAPQNMLAAEALGIMESRKITALIVENQNQPIGVIHMHDLLRAGVV